MTCCKCCCEAKTPPGVCCGPAGEDECCQPPRTCCQGTNENNEPTSVCCGEDECCDNGQCVQCPECEPPCGECHKCVNGECVYDFEACPTCESLYGEWQLTVNWCGLTGIATNENPGFFVQVPVDPPVGTCIPIGAPGNVFYLMTARFRYQANDGGPVRTYDLFTPNPDPETGEAFDFSGCDCLGGFRLILGAPSDCPGDQNPGGLLGWSLWCTRGYRAFVCDGELFEVREYPVEPSTFGVCTFCEDTPTVNLAFGGAP